MGSTKAELPHTCPPVIPPSFHKHLLCARPWASLGAAAAVEARPLLLASHGPGHKYSKKSTGWCQRGRWEEAQAAGVGGERGAEGAAHFTPGRQRGSQGGLPGGGSGICLGLEW